MADNAGVSFAMTTVIARGRHEACKARREALEEGDEDDFLAKSNEFIDKRLSSIIAQAVVSCMKFGS